MWMFCLSSSKKNPDSAVIRLIITQQKRAEAGEKTCHQQVAHGAAQTYSLNKSTMASKRTQMWDSFVFFFLPLLQPPETQLHLWGKKEGLVLLQILPRA